MILLLLFKSSACLALFMLFYKCCLEQTSAHTIKRYFLIAVILISISIPFISFTEYVHVDTLSDSVSSQVTEFQVANSSDSSIFQDYLPTLLWSIYAVGVLLFLFRFIINLNQIIQKIKINPKLKKEQFINVLLQDLKHPHTFFNYIFLNKTKYESNQILPEVLLHEQTHANQKHALDILFIEVVQIVFWFNPLLHFIKKDIKLNHEFLADRAVIKNGFNTKKYQQLLLTFSSNVSDSSLANAINYSLIKKRFTVMKTQTSKTSLRIRSILMLPLLAFLIYGFGNKETKYVETNTAFKSDTTEDSIPYELVPNSSSYPAFLLNQQKATPKQIAEYNKLARHYNSMTKKNKRVYSKDVERLKYLYDLMSPAQRKNAEAFPNIPEPPTPIAKSTYPKKVKEAKAPRAAKAAFVPLGIESVPPPPPPIPANATPDEREKYTGVIKRYNEEHGNLNDVPPPPPPPKSPLQHVKEMANKGAKFFLDGEPIPSEKAIDAVKKNKKLNILIDHSNEEDYVVKLSTTPIILED